MGNFQIVMHLIDRLTPSIHDAGMPKRRKSTNAAMVVSRSFGNVCCRLMNLLARLARPCLRPWASSKVIWINLWRTCWARLRAMQAKQTKKVQRKANRRNQSTAGAGLGGRRRKLGTTRPRRVKEVMPKPMHWPWRQPSNRTSFFYHVVQTKSMCRTSVAYAQAGSSPKGRLGRQAKWSPPKSGISCPSMWIAICIKPILHAVREKSRQQLAKEKWRVRLSHWLRQWTDLRCICTRPNLISGCPLQIWKQLQHTLIQKMLTQTGSSDRPSVSKKCWWMTVKADHVARLACCFARANQSSALHWDLPKSSGHPSSCTPLSLKMRKPLQNAKSRWWRQTSSTGVIPQCSSSWRWIWRRCKNGCGKAGYATMRCQTLWSSTLTQWFVRQCESMWPRSRLACKGLFAKLVCLWPLEKLLIKSWQNWRLHPLLCRAPCEITQSFWGSRSNVGVSLRRSNEGWQRWLAAAAKNLNSKKSLFGTPASSWQSKQQTPHWFVSLDWTPVHVTSGCQTYHWTTCPSLPWPFCGRTSWNRMGLASIRSMCELLAPRSVSRFVPGRGWWLPGGCFDVLKD